MGNQNYWFKEKHELNHASRIEDHQIQQELTDRYGINIDVVLLNEYVNFIAKEVPDGELLVSDSERVAYEKLIFMVKTLESIGRTDLVQQIEGFKKCVTV